MQDVLHLNKLDLRSCGAWSFPVGLDRILHHHGPNRQWAGPAAHDVDAKALGAWHKWPLKERNQDRTVFMGVTASLPKAVSRRELPRDTVSAQEKGVVE